LFDVESIWNRNLTGLDIWDYQAYPFQQTLSDIQYLDEAIAALQATTPDAATAKEALANVAMTYDGLVFGPGVYTKELVRHEPDYELITWAGQVDRPWAVDLLPVLDEIDAAQYATAITALQTVRGIEIDGGHVSGATMGGFDFDGLSARVEAMTTTLNALTTDVQALK